MDNVRPEYGGEARLAMLNMIADACEMKGFVIADQYATGDRVGREYVKINGEWYGNSYVDIVW